MTYSPTQLFKICKSTLPIIKDVTEIATHALRHDRAGVKKQFNQIYTKLDALEEITELKPTD